MKKVIAILLSFVMVVALCGCLDTSKNTAPQVQQANNAQAAAPAASGGTTVQTVTEYVESYPDLEGNYTSVTPDVTLRYSLNAPAGDNVEWRAAAAFREYVEASSNGKIQVQLYPSHQLGGEADSFALVAAGDLDLCTITDGNLAGFVPAMSAMAVPYLFASGPISWQVLDSEFGQNLKKALFETTSARALGIGEDGFRSFGTAGKQVKVLEDLKGMKIRVMETPVYLNMMNALAALPTPMSGSEVYNAIEQKVVDGFENSPDVMYSMNFYEVLDYLTIDQHSLGSAWLCISDKAWKSLDADSQAIVAAGGQVWQYYLRAPKEIAATKAMVDMAAKGVEVYVMPASERQRLKDACQGVVVDYMRGSIGNEWVDLLLRCTEEAEKKIIGSLN